MFFLEWLTVSEPSSIGRQRDRNGLSSFACALRRLDSLNELTLRNRVMFRVSVQRGNRAIAFWLISIRTNVSWPISLLLPVEKDEAIAARSSSDWACIAWDKIEIRCSFAPYALDYESLASNEEKLFRWRLRCMVAESSRLVKMRKKRPLQSGWIAG